MTAEERAKFIVDEANEAEGLLFDWTLAQVRATQQEAADEALERAAQACEAMGDRCGGDGEGCTVHLDAAHVVRSLKSTPGSEGGGR